jgi:serine/threonine protein kinase
VIHLGQGAYGSVSKALYKPTGELVAIKIVPNSNDEIDHIKKEV